LRPIVFLTIASEKVRISFSKIENCPNRDNGDLSASAGADGVFPEIL
jgi:hypothetical protein